MFHEEGSIAEVVSQFEYEKARALGIPGEKIIFSGPYKPLAALKTAVEENAHIQVDHFQEIEDIEQIARQLNKKVGIGIRLNLDSGIYPQWSLEEVFRRVKEVLLAMSDYLGLNPTLGGSL